MADADIIPKYIPALSSTGDVPVFLSPPPTSEDAGGAASSDGGAPTPSTEPPVEPAGGENQDDIRSPGLPAEPPAEEPTEAEPPPSEAKPDPRTARRREDAERIARLEGMLAEAIGALKTRAEPPPPVAPVLPPPDPKPSRADFDDPDAYDAAHAKWAARIAVSEYAARQAAEKAETDKQAADARAAEQQKAINDQWQQRRREAAAKRADYEDAQSALIEATNEFSNQQTAAISALIQTSPDGAELAYFLGKNPAEAKRIASLQGGPLEQVFEMAKISAKLSQPKPVEVSRTPAPIAPLRGPAAAHEKTLEEMVDPGNASVYIEAKRAKRAAEFVAKQGQRPH